MIKETIIPMRDHDFLRKGLYDLCDYLKNRIGTPLYNLSLCEIGSYTGESSLIFSEHFKQVVCIDPWSDTVQDPSDPAYTPGNFSDVESRFDDNISKTSNIIKVKGFSDQIAIEIEEKNIKFDVIYIDGLHTYDQVKKDIENYRKFSTRAICGHDYNENNWPGVKRAVDESFQGLQIQKFIDTSWAVII